MIVIYIFSLVSSLHMIIEVNADSACGRIRTHNLKYTNLLQQSILMEFRFGYLERLVCLQR